MKIDFAFQFHYAFDASGWQFSDQKSLLKSNLSNQGFDSWMLVLIEMLFPLYAVRVSLVSDMANDRKRLLYLLSYSNQLSRLLQRIVHRFQISIICKYLV